jgi:hypothetical protein
MMRGFDGGSRDPAISALCVMAFLSSGHVPGEGKYGATIEKGIRFVCNQQQQNGVFAAKQFGMTVMVGLGGILAEARTGTRPPDSLAALFAPITTQWKSLTGKPPVTTVGWNEPPSGAAGGAGGALLALGLAFGLWYFTKKG